MEKEEISPTDTGRYRMIAARANYLSMDRPDIQYATQGICMRDAEAHQFALEQKSRG